jgi:hypothetical protein
MDCPEGFRAWAMDKGPGIYCEVSCPTHRRMTAVLLPQVFHRRVQARMAFDGPATYSDQAHIRWIGALRAPKSDARSAKGRETTRMEPNRPRLTTPCEYCQGLDDK